MVRPWIIGFYLFAVITSVVSFSASLGLVGALVLALLATVLVGLVGETLRHEMTAVEHVSPADTAPVAAAQS